MRILVLHGSYGCETGCCGHYVEIDGKSVGKFEFLHPNENNDLEFAQDMVRAACGEEHVKDLDWEHCIIVNGDSC
jgi:hypothetical protein